MADAKPTDAAAHAEDAKVREEWRRLERQRLDEEIAEAREDAGTAGQQRRGPNWLAWLVFAVALVAGIALAALVNSLVDFRR